MRSQTEKFFETVMCFFAAVVADVVRAFTLSCLWVWFVLFCFPDLPEIPAPVFFGLLLFISIVKGHKPSKEPFDLDRAWEVIGSTFLRSGIALCLGALIHHFML